MTKIVIIGAGRSGLLAALELEKNNHNVTISLVDKHNYSLDKSKLFWAASSKEDITSVEQIEKKATLPLNNLLFGRNIEFIQGEVEKVDPKINKVFLHNKSLEYDFLILAMGSQANFKDIPGAEKHSLKIKGLADALRVRNDLNFLIQSHRLDSVKKKIKIAIAGAGKSGIEFSADLVDLLDFLAWENEYPRENLEIILYEAAHRLLPKFNYELSREVFFRIKKLNISIEADKEIIKVDHHFIDFKDGEKTEYDLLIWTAGTIPEKILIESHKFQNHKPADLLVDEQLRVYNLHNILAIGSQNGLGKMYNPKHQAQYVSYAFSKFLQNKKPIPYKQKLLPLFIKIGPKWAIFSFSKSYFKGCLGFVVGKLANQ